MGFWDKVDAFLAERKAHRDWWAQATEEERWAWIDEQWPTIEPLIKTLYYKEH